MVWSFVRSPIQDSYGTVPLFFAVTVWSAIALNSNILLAQDETTLRHGDFGKKVEQLQRMLNGRLKPSPELAIDGDFGDATEAAVKRFQRTHSLVADGVVTDTVWKKLGPLIAPQSNGIQVDLINKENPPKLPADSLAGRPFVTAKAFAAADLKSGKMLFSNNADKVLDIASTTKIMTAYLVLQLAENKPEILNETVTFSSRADSTRGSTAGVRTGEKLPVSELLFGLLLPSGNDASVALAEHFGNRVGPDQRSENHKTVTDPYLRFIQAMNQMANALKMNATQFKNPHGLTESGHHSTAADLVKLTVAAMKMDRFRKYVSTRKRACRLRATDGTQRNVVWKNTNRLLAIQGYLGVKTGTTSAAGACLVSAAERQGQEIVLVVLGSESSNSRYVDSRNLYRWIWNQLDSAAVE